MAKLFRLVPVTVASAALMAFACSSGSADGTAGSGGAPAGGADGSGGAAAGGTVAAGGADAAGGTVAAGGADAAGGTDSGAGGSAPACAEEWGTTGEMAGIDGFGNIYQYFDECYSSISTTATDGKICTKGAAAEVVDMKYSEIWGAGVGLQVEADAAVDLSAYTGFKFTIDTPPGALRIGVLVKGVGDAFFTETVAAGENTVLFAALEQGSWVETPAELDLTQITDIQFQIPANASAEEPFEFCLSGIELIGGGDPGGTGGASGTGGEGSGTGGEGTGGEGTGGDMGSGGAATGGEAPN